MIRRKRRREWEIKVTTPAMGTVLEVSTIDIEHIWHLAGRSNDGYAEILKLPGMRIWVKPRGHAEPDRSQLLRGTGSAPAGIRSGR